MRPTGDRFCVQASLYSGSISSMAAVTNPRHLIYLADRNQNHRAQSCAIPLPDIWATEMTFTTKPQARPVVVRPRFSAT